MQRTYRQTKFRDSLVDFAVITLGTFISAAAVFFFLLPSCTSVGSISGLALVVHHFVPLPISLITFLFNLVLLILGFLIVGREFGAKTVYTSLLLPVFLAIFERRFPAFESIMGDPFLDVVGYVFLVSVGQAMLFVRNASSGGLDIVAKLLNKLLRMELGKAMSASGMVVALSSALIYDAKTVVLSVLGTYLNGVVLDHFIFGIDPKRRVCIVSDKLEEIRTFIVHQLHSGATIYESIGAYTLEPRREIITIVDKSEYGQLMKYVMQLDPKAFVTVYTVSEVCYQPKQRRISNKAEV